MGNLSYFCTNKALAEVFSTVGPVQGAMVRKSRRNQPLHYGFVEMTREDAFKALEVIQNKDFMGRKLRVALRRGVSDDMAPQLHFHSIHLSFVTSDTATPINEGYLMQAFSSFGGLEDCVVKQHVLSKRRQKQGGYAFLYFQSQAAAEHVIEQVKLVGGKFGNVLYDAKFSCTSPGGLDNFSVEDGAFHAAEMDGHHIDFQEHSKVYQLVHSLSLSSQTSNQYSLPPDQGARKSVPVQLVASVSGSMDTVIDYNHPAINNSSASTPTTSFYSSPSYPQSGLHGNALSSASMHPHPHPTASPAPYGVNTPTQSFYVSSSAARHSSSRFLGHAPLPNHAPAPLPNMQYGYAVMQSQSEIDASARHGVSLNYAGHPPVMHMHPTMMSSDSGANRDRSVNIHDIKSNPNSPGAAPVHMSLYPNGMHPVAPVYYPAAYLAQSQIISAQSSFRPYNPPPLVYYPMPSQHQQHLQSAPSLLTPHISQTAAQSGSMSATPVYYAYPTGQPSHLSINRD